MHQTVRSAEEGKGILRSTAFGLFLAAVCQCKSFLGILVRKVQMTERGLRIRKRGAGNRRSPSRRCGVRRRTISESDHRSREVPQLWEGAKFASAWLLHDYMRWVTEALYGRVLRMAVRRFFVGAAQ